MRGGDERETERDRDGERRIEVRKGEGEIHTLRHSEATVILKVDVQTESLITV